MPATGRMPTERIPTKGHYSQVVDAITQPVAPTSGNNPTTILSFNVAGDLIKIQKTIQGVTYEKTLSNDDMVVSETQTISSWSET